MTDTNTTHANLTADEFDAALSIYDVPCTDEDGEPELMTVVVTASSVGYGHDINVYQGGEIVDHDTAYTIDDAGAIATAFVAKLTEDDRAMARTRIRDARVNARETLMNAADELTGEAADAARILALLIGAGRGAVALAALQRIATK